GAKVTIANTGREALDALAARSFDVVLMDVQMPEMGGFEATCVIRERERATGAHVPIIAMTAHAMRGDRERCLEAGMDEYLSKPVEPRRLLALLESIADGPPAAVEPDCTESLFSAIVANTAGDAELAAEVCAVFVAELPGYGARVRAALDARDGEELRQAAHALKGAAANFGETPTVAAARALEQRARAGEMDGIESLWPELDAAAASLGASLAQAIE